MKLCAFTSSNENYLMQAVASLTSAKKWQPELDLFFLTEKLSSTGELILKSYGIEPIITSLDGHFTRFWSYPRECYYLFAAPEILLRLGYGAGFYIDADTIVNGDLRSMPQGDHFISGVSVGKVHEILKNDILV